MGSQIRRVSVFRFSDLKVLCNGRFQSRCEYVPCTHILTHHFLVITFIVHGKFTFSIVRLRAFQQCGNPFHSKSWFVVLTSSISRKKKQSSNDFSFQKASHSHWVLHKVWSTLTQWYALKFSFFFSLLISYAKMICVQCWCLEIYWNGKIMPVICIRFKCAWILFHPK